MMRKNLVLLLFIIIPFLLLSAQNKKMILDADTGNEMDDLYAISRILLDKDVDLIALSSAHFNNSALVSDSVYISRYINNGYTTLRDSHKLNEQLVKACSREDVPLIWGSNRIIGEGWGITERASPSPASAKIISEARKTPDGEKLDVMCIGASTNLASALMEAPDIAPKIRAWMLGAQCDTEKGIWNKGEYNIRNDLNAFDYLLECEPLELHVMGTNVALALRFQQKETQDRLKGDDLLTRMLYDRWAYQKAVGSWIMWDLALVEAYLTPSTAKEIMYPAPAENGGRLIHVFTWIDAPRIEKTFWQYYDQFMKKIGNCINS